MPCSRAGPTERQPPRRPGPPHTQRVATSDDSLTASGNVAYRGRRNIDTLFVNVFRNSQSNVPKTERWEFGNDYRYLLGDRWYLTATQDFTAAQGIPAATGLLVFGPPAVSPLAPPGAP